MSRVKVFLNLRSLDERELEQKGRNYVQVHGDGKSVSDGQSDDEKKETLTFDQVFDENKHGQLYQLSVYPLVRDFLSGRSCCLILYGPKESGKTYSLMGKSSSAMPACKRSQGGGCKPLDCSVEGLENSSDHRPVAKMKDHGYTNTATDGVYAEKSNYGGIISRIVSDVFEHRSVANEKSIDMYCSLAYFFEGNVYDLFLDTGECSGKGKFASGQSRLLFSIDGVSEENVVREHDFMEKIDSAWKRMRKIHDITEDVICGRTVFTLHLESVAAATAPTGSLCIVDLAGRDPETTVGNAKWVTNQVATPSLHQILEMLTGKNSSLSFADSTLANLLQNWVESEAQTTFIATASPYSFGHEESLNSIRLGLQAKEILEGQRKIDKVKKENIPNDGNHSELIQLMEQMSAEMQQFQKKTAQDPNSYETKLQSSNVDFENNTSDICSKRHSDVGSLESEQPGVVVGSEVCAPIGPENNLAAEREELNSVASLLRLAAKRIEADLSLARGELAAMSLEENKEDPTTSYSGGGRGASVAQLSDEPNQSEHKQVEFEIVESDKAQAKNSAICHRSHVEMTTLANNDIISKSVTSSLERKLSREDALRELENKEHLVNEMDKELAALRNENKTLSRVKGRREDELARTKKEIRMLSLRAFDMEQKLEKLRSKDAEHAGGRAIPGVRNIVGRQYLSEREMLCDVPEETQHCPDEDDLASMDGDHICGKHISVCLRLRPVSCLEVNEQSKCCIKVHNDQKNITVDSLSEGKYKFTFDRVFDEDVSQSAIHDFFGDETVSYILAGENCCVLSYGARSSGKTYTIMGDMGRLSRKTISSTQNFGKEYVDEHAGVTPRLIRSLFAGISRAARKVEFSLRCSFIAVYLENIFDLLGPRKIVSPLMNDKRVQGDEASEAWCFREADAFALINRGAEFLAKLSSRKILDAKSTHLIFTVKVEQRDISTSQRKEGTLRMVDFAACLASGDDNDREAKITQRPFTVLTNIVERLSEGHIDAPYDESTLTYLLKDAFGGNCRTTMFIAASSSSFNISETINIFRFGTRLQSVINLPRCNIKEDFQTYRKWLLDSEIKRGELVEFVKQLSECLSQKENNKVMRDVRLWDSLNAVVTEEDYENSPCRSAFCLDQFDELRKYKNQGLKWQALAFSLEHRSAADDCATAIKAREHAESLVSDLQREIIAVRRQNDVLVHEKNKKKEEMVTARKEAKLLTLQKSNVEQEVEISKFQEEVSAILLRKLRKLCWSLETSFIMSRSSGLGEFAALISCAPGLSGLGELDCDLLEAGLIRTQDLISEDSVGSFDVHDVEETAKSQSDIEFPTISSVDSVERLEATGDVAELTELETGPEQASMKKGRPSLERVVSSMRRLRNEGSIRSLENYEASEKTPLVYKRFFSATTSSSTERERLLYRTIRTCVADCLQLQKSLKAEKAMVEMLTTASGLLHQRRLTQDVTSLQNERDRSIHSAKTAMWKVHELHVLNQSLEKEAEESREHIAFLRNGFQRLQETFRTTALDSIDGDAQLRKQVATLQTVLNSLSLPARHSVSGASLPMPADCINLSMRGRFDGDKETEKTDGKDASTLTAQDVFLVPSDKIPEQTVAGLKRRKAKYCRRSRKTGDSNGGLRKRRFVANKRFQRLLVKFSGDITKVLQ